MGQVFDPLLFAGTNCGTATTRIHPTLTEVANRSKNLQDRNIDPFGRTVADFVKTAGPHISDLLGQPLKRKNRAFNYWAEKETTRCIVIVTNDSVFQDDLTRFVACRKLHQRIHNLGEIHFEELLWLPDLSNGAWFLVGKQKSETRCFVDWQDDPDDMLCRKNSSVARRELDLKADFPTYRANRQYSLMEIICRKAKIFLVKRELRKLKETI